MALDCVKARIIDDRKLIRIGLIRIDLRSLPVVDSTELSRNSKGMVFWNRPTRIDDRRLRKRVRINAIRTRLRSSIIGALTRPKFTISDGVEYSVLS